MIRLALDWVTSLFAGRWLVITWALVSLCSLGAAFWWGSHRTETRWEARWEARELAYTNAALVAQAAADAAVARQKQATIDAARLFTEKQNENSILAARNTALARRLQDSLAAGRDHLPAAPADPAGTEPEGGGVDAVAVAIALSGFSRGCAESRDQLAAQVNALLEAWPR